MKQRPISNTNKFGLKDVGLTHPDNDAFIKIDGAGRIYVMSNPNLGFIIDPTHQSITWIGDKVKVVTKEDEGFKWNNLTFNSAATNFAEPTFTYRKDITNSIYDEVDRFLV